MNKNQLIGLLGLCMAGIGLTWHEQLGDVTYMLNGVGGFMWGYFFFKND